MATTNELLLSCDDCYGEPVPYTELVSFGGQSLCPDCAWKAATETLEPLLSARWSPGPESLRLSEEGLRVVEMLLARVKARLRVERTKLNEAAIAEFMEPRPSHETAEPEFMDSEGPGTSPDHIPSVSQ